MNKEKAISIVWIGKASDVFSEIALCAKWERYHIGWKIYCFTIFNLN